MTYTNESVAIRLNDLAAELSVFRPVLAEICDQTELSPAVFGYLEMIGCLSNRINFELSNIAAELQGVKS